MAFFKSVNARSEIDSFVCYVQARRYQRLSLQVWEQKQVLTFVVVARRRIDRKMKFVCHYFHRAAYVRQVIIFSWQIGRPKLWQVPLTSEPYGRPHKANGSNYKSCRSHIERYLLNIVMWRRGIGDRENLCTLCDLWQRDSETRLLWEWEGENSPGPNRKKPRPIAN